MGRFQDFVTQNPLKRKLLDVATPQRRAIAQAYRRESQLVFRPPDEVASYQQQQFQHLLNAARKAPYWKQVLDSLGKPITDLRLT